MAKKKRDKDTSSLNMEHLPTGDAQEWEEFQEGFNLFYRYYIYLRD